MEYLIKVKVIEEEEVVVAEEATEVASTEVEVAEEATEVASMVVEVVAASPEVLEVETHYQPGVPVEDHHLE